MNILDAIKHAIDGNAVLFLGSGFSYGAKNLLNSSPKTGREFASDLYKLAEVPSKDENLMIASQIYYRKFGAAALSTLCRETFTIKQAAPHHITIASLKWQRIYTTNYDDLAERSSIENGKSLTPVTLEDSPERYLSSSKVCVHINGFINRLTTSDLTSHFKLTLASYFSDHFSGSLWRRIFDQDLSSARAVIFVGYSMYDLDIQRFVYAADIKDKTVFICSPTLQENDSDSFILPEFGTLFPIGVQKFADEITEILGKYKPSPQPTTFASIQEIKVTASIAVPTNADIEKLFLFGNIQTNLIGYNSSIAENGFYLVDRTQLNHAEDALISGHDVILTSDVGNGKSIAAEQLSLRMTALGWRVFRVTADTKEVRKEAIQLLDAGGNIALVIDNYIPFLDLIDHFSVRRQGKNFKFILTCRSYVHDAFADRLEKRLYSTNITEIDVNRLGEDDNQKLIRMIDSFGLWSDFSAHSHQQKQNFLTNECNNQLHQVLLRLYAAPQMSERINRLFEDITPQVRRLVVAAMILNLSGLLVLKETLDDLLNNSPLMHLTNTDKESVKFIWSDVAGQIKLKSSALAEHYLKNLANSGEVVGIIIEMFDSAHEIYESRIYKRPTSEQFMRSIMSFSTLQKMIPENGFRPATIRFYEAIQTKTFVRKNPHFWLQYAIARLSFEDSLTEIETYFQSAYKHAEEINYDPFQIDNHYARLLLIRAIKEPFSVTTFSNYSKAKSIVMNQVALGATRKHYPYRVATLVLDLVKIHGEKFDQKQIKDFALFCGDILTRIEKSNQSIREHKHTIFCKKAMSDTLRELESYTPK